MPKSQKPKPLIVMKFGGTSVGNAERMQDVAEIVARHAPQNEIVVVVSAMGGVTDMLMRAATEASQGDRENWKNVRRELAHRHREVADRLLSASEQAAVLPRLAKAMADFENLCSGFSLVREVTPRAMDTLSSLGEVMSANLVAAILRSRGVAAEAVDATELIVTDDNFGNAAPLFEETTCETGSAWRPAAARRDSGHHRLPRRHARRPLHHAGPRRVRLQRHDRGRRAGRRRGLDLDRRRWRDDHRPRLVPEARILPEISYREAIELSFFGAKVLHPKTIQPVMKKKIPVWIKNSFNPEGPGTWIVRHVQERQAGRQGDHFRQQGRPDHDQRQGIAEFPAPGHARLQWPSPGRCSHADGHAIFRGQCAVLCRARCGSGAREEPNWKRPLSWKCCTITAARLKSCPTWPSWWRWAKT